MKRATFGFVLLLSLLMTGCIPSELDGAEHSLSKAHQELQSRRRALESTNSAIGSAVSSKMDYAMRLRNAEYQRIAQSGGLGVGEQLIAANKMLNDPTYETRMRELDSSSKREAEFAESRMESLNASRQREQLSIREYLSTAKAALEAYERAFKAQESKTGERPTVSEKTRRMVMDIEYALISDQVDRQMQKNQEESQKDAAKRK